MDINVYNLDNAYTQCSELHNLVTRNYANGGQELINRLEANIASLRINWTGSDATAQINNLIRVHDALVALVTDAKAVISGAADRIIAIQRVRNSNGAVNSSVGQALDASAPAHQSINAVAETVEFNVRPTASNDSVELGSIYNAYNSFVSELTEAKTALFQNWTAGADVETAKSYFDRFLNNSETYRGYLQSAKANLETAISNMAQL